MVPNRNEVFRKRIKVVIDTVFAGSQQKLAEAIEVSPALLSRVIGGDRPPSRKLLHAISQLPQINADWLQTGKGEPIQTQPQILADIGAIVPVAKQLLPGPLLAFESLLSHRFVSVPRAFYSATTYAIDVQSCGCDASFLKNQFCKPEDTLVIETDVEICRALDQKHDNRLGVFFVQDQGAYLASEASKVKMVIRQQDPTRPLTDRDIHGSMRKPRAIQFDDEAVPDIQKSNVNPSARDKDESNNLVGVVTLMFREH